MKNIILAIMFVFSVVWSQDAAAARASKSKKKPTVTQKKQVAKNKKAKVRATPEVASEGNYRSSYLRKKYSKKGRSVASVSSKKVKSDKKSKAKKSKKRH